MKMYWQNDDRGDTGKPAGLPYQLLDFRDQGFGREPQSGTPATYALPAWVIQPDANVTSMGGCVDGGKNTN